MPNETTLQYTELCHLLELSSDEATLQDFASFWEGFLLMATGDRAQSCRTSADRFACITRDRKMSSTSG